MDSLPANNKMADLSDSSVFYGFTNEEIDYVSSDIWKIIPKLNSCSIQIHHEETFDFLESQICSLYGSPQLMGNNGHIYRGDLSTVSGNNIGVTITCYKTTLLVRVQGSGYAMFINKVLPTFVDKIPRNVSKTPSPVCAQVTNASTPQHNSTPTPVYTSTPVTKSTPAHTAPVSNISKSITTHTSKGPKS